MLFVFEIFDPDPDPDPDPERPDDLARYAGQTEATPSRPFQAWSITCSPQIGK